MLGNADTDVFLGSEGGQPQYSARVGPPPTGVLNTGGTNVWLVLSILAHTEVTSRVTEFQHIHILSAHGFWFGLGQFSSLSNQNIFQKSAFTMSPDLTVKISLVNSQSL